MTVAPQYNLFCLNSPATHGYSLGWVSDPPTIFWFRPRTPQTKNEKILIKKHFKDSNCWTTFSIQLVSVEKAQTWTQFHHSSPRDNPIKPTANAAYFLLCFLNSHLNSIRTPQTAKRLPLSAILFCQYPQSTEILQFLVWASIVTEARLIMAQLSRV